MYLLGTRHVPVVFRGISLKRGDLILAPPGSEFCGSSCSIDSDRTIAVRVAAERLRDDLRALRRADLPSGPIVLRLTQRQLARLESLVVHALVEPPAGGIEQRELEGDLVSAVVAAVPADAPSRKADESCFRVFGTARKFLQESLDESIQMADLCRVAGVPERTLRRAFQREVGVSPIAFLRAQRLARARRLIKHHAVQSVTAAALQSGFTEFGRFAGYYHAMFGELPSDTFAQRVERGRIGRWPNTHGGLHGSL